MVSDTLLRLALCVAQGSLDFDTLLRFVTLGDSESLVKRYTSVLRPFGLLNALVMRYTLVSRALLSSIMRTLVLCALLGGMRMSGAIHIVYRPLWADYRRSMSGAIHCWCTGPSGGLRSMSGAIHCWCTGH